MTTKLSKITTKYRTFEENQVLTKDQLNEFINYFDVQDRMSRVFLNGVGIACGLKLKEITSSSITITQGVGITTDGDLITLDKQLKESDWKTIQFEKLTFTHYKKFEDTFANYSFFQKEKVNSGSSNMELVELLTDKAENAQPLSSLKNLKDKTVLLYLESYAKKGNLCTTIDCDSQGVEQVARLRVLLISNEDAKQIIEKDSMFKMHDLSDRLNELPELAMKRVVLNSSNTKNYKMMEDAYFAAIKDGGTLEKLINGVDILYSHFEQALNLEVLKDDFQNFEQNVKKIIDNKTNKDIFGFQYIYDLVKDIVDTWNEIINLLQYLNEACFPDIKAFPKHLLLGQLNEEEIEIKRNRHRFYKSSASTNEFGKVEKCRKLIERLISLPAYFVIPSGEIRITPSNLHLSLSKRAVPFYYKVDENLLKNWDFNKSKKSNHKKNLSYHRDKLSNIQHIQDPLNYNLDKLNFFRIEGHQGKNYKDALKNILEQKRSYGLPFDVKALSLNINPEEIDLNDYKAEFEDLSIILKAWQTEQKCVLAEAAAFLSSLEIDKPNNEDKKPGDSDKPGKPGRPPKKDEPDIEIPFPGFPRGPKKPGKPPYDKLDISGESFIYNNLTLKENTIGKLLGDAFDVSPTQQANDVIMSTQKKFNFEIQDKKIDMSKDKETFLSDSIELIAWSNDLIHKMPQVIDFIKPESINNYTTSLNEVCKRVEKLKKDLSTYKLHEQTKATMSLQLSQLVGICCSGKKLEVLSEEIEKRKLEIITGLQLSEFIEKHPGLEHNAGVPSGGTFIIVFAAKSQDVKGDRRFNLVKDLKISDLIDISTGDKKAQFNRLEDYFDIIRKESAMKIDTVDVKNRVEKEDIGVTTTDQSQVVIADFSVPYLCCSGSRVVNFMLEKEEKPHKETTVKLDKNDFCENDETEYPFIIEPENAEVEIQGEGVTKSENAYFFTPKLAGVGKHTFNVNGEEADITVEVYEIPEAKIEIEKLENKVVVHNLSKGASSYNWFIDNQKVDERTETSSYEIEFDPNDGVSLYVSLEAISKFCGLHRTDIRVDIERTDICFDRTIKQIKNDFEALEKIKFESDWKLETEKVYNEVMNNNQAYLSGGKNDNLKDVLMQLMESTSKMLVEIQDDKEMFSSIVQLFELQLRLLYNILRCQPKYAVEKYAEELYDLFKKIIELLYLLKNSDIKLSDLLRDFIKEFIAQVEHSILKDHGNEILEIGVI